MKLGDFLRPNETGENRTLIEIESAIIEARDDERTAWAEVEEFSRVMQGNLEMEGYFVEVEGCETEPNMDEMESAFGAAIKSWVQTIERKVKELAARIQAWLDKQFNKMDEAFWEKNADKAFEDASNCKKDFSMRDWKWTESSGSEFTATLKTMVDAFSTKADSIGNSTKDSDIKGDAAEKGDKLEARLTSAFCNSDYKKKKSVKLSTLSGEKGNFEKIFKSARADRQALKDAKSELKSIESNLKKLSSSKLGEKGGKSLGPIKKDISTAISFCSKGTSLVMERRANIKTIVGMLVSHTKTKDSKDKND